MKNLVLFSYVIVVELVVYPVLGNYYVLCEVETNVMFLELVKVLECAMIGDYIEALVFSLFQG